MAQQYSIWGAPSPKQALAVMRCSAGSSLAPPDCAVMRSLFARLCVMRGEQQEGVRCEDGDGGEMERRKDS
jgi:hypothetical protein